MAVMMHVRASAGRRVIDPDTGIQVPEDRPYEIRVTSTSMRLVNQGILVKETPQKPKRPVKAKKLDKVDDE